MISTLFQRALPALALLLVPGLGFAQAEETATAYGVISVLPPLLAVALALWWRQIIPALFLGIWLGAWALNGFTLTGLGVGLLESFQRYIVAALADSDHAAVILFSAMIGGMVGLITRNGGLAGVVTVIVSFASSVRRASMATVALGMAIFFDDYANSLVVGNTMRPITDRHRISREKLAYLVDSTAAPIACIALVTTWIGYQVGLIRSALEDMPGVELNAYFVFLNAIPYSFYPLFALVLIVTVVWSGRDFGPMLAAERRARHEGEVAPPARTRALIEEDNQHMAPDEDKPQRAINALLPIATLVITVVVGIYMSGEGETLQEIVGSADPYKSLLWGSLLGVLSAAAMTLGQRILDLGEVTSAWFAGVRSMLLAIVILILAWGLSAITTELGTAQYLADLVGEHLHPGLLPALVFVLAAFTAFATGSSWGTMAILVPLMLPLTWTLMQGAGMSDPSDLAIIYAVVAGILGGAVWGDHCSPISDTTILSSMASQCDHVEHVRTQLPYALFAGFVALLIGALPAGFGAPFWLLLPLGALVLVIGMRLIGKTVE
ncbi:Na+/H+ antiporter NhaC family protein [Wenzhouxiangella marina]|uniref:Na+/H+ antiporter NhaC-like protein n=1 Tax=Wenzhouxiangella marina TaxID=1579979 RepID=A0A0K0XWA8_9GAMM|nr:Na+/H+ antiporter NhaC family protein [Wenzhouxiangella marina]AKS41989.1 Na+/H+ antiporter NhaC-like protein [Wenzhouxiangella marina]MBB6086244.1 Na+/H+ antiporter NhaC [Wenzhouxiangella marina]